MDSLRNTFTWVSRFLVVKCVMVCTSPTLWVPTWASSVLLMSFLPWYPSEGRDDFVDTGIQQLEGLLPFSVNRLQ